MSKKKQKTTEATLTSIAPVEPTRVAAPDFRLDPNTIWIGRDAMRHIMENAEESYYGYFSEGCPDQSPT